MMRVARWVVILAVLYSLIDLAEWGFLRGEITVYAGICDETVRANYCDAPSHLARPVTYTVYPEQQTVVYGMEGMPLQRWTKCAIANRRNWTCRSEDETEEFGFVGGAYFHLDSQVNAATVPLEEREYSMPRWRYRLRQLFRR